ncbi:MAG: hypothetical protein NTW19_04365 [Planctomycetota bacterium]|nr:hypothetical protein [Planctomycetota bacterium]
MAVVVLCAMVAIGAMPGCSGPGPVAATRPAASQPAPTVDAPAATAPARPSVTIAATQPVKGADLFPLRKAAGMYDITRDDKLTPGVPYKLEPDAANGWTLAIGDLRVVNLRLDPDGSVLVTREDELGDNLSVTYTPAIRMLPATLTPSQPQEFDCQLVVRSMKDQSVRDKGDCRYTVEYLGTQQVQTPAGEFTAAMVRTTRQMNLNLASVRVTMLTAYVPEKGVVVQRVEEVRRMLGLFSSKSSEESRLAR